MDEQYGLSMGCLPVAGEGKLLRTASGDIFAVSKMFRNITVVLGKGTADELAVTLDFWAVKGLALLAEVILPTTAEHKFAVAGIDRVECVLRYRPRYAACGDKRTAELPVVCHRKGENMVAAVLADAEVALGPVLHESRVVLTTAERLGVQQGGVAAHQVRVPARPRYSHLRRLLVLLLVLMSAVCGIGAVGAVPVHPVQGGTFRPHP
jgi:hypothetical protein